MYQCHPTYLKLVSLNFFDLHILLVGKTQPQIGIIIRNRNNILVYLMAQGELYYNRMKLSVVFAVSEEKMKPPIIIRNVGKKYYR